MASKNSRSSRKVIVSYEKKQKEKKQFIWLEENCPREKEVKEMGYEPLGKKRSFGKNYLKYNNPNL